MPTDHLEPHDVVPACGAGHARRAIRLPGVAREEDAFARIDLESPDQSAPLPPQRRGGRTDRWGGPGDLVGEAGNALEAAHEYRQPRVVLTSPAGLPAEEHETSGAGEERHDGGGFGEIGRELRGRRETPARMLAQP